MWIPSRGVNGEYGYLNTETGEFRTTLPNSKEEKLKEQLKLRKAVLVTHSARLAKYERTDAKRKNHSDETAKKQISVPIMTMNPDGTFTNNYVLLMAPNESSLSTHDPIAEFYIGAKALNPVFNLLGKGYTYGMARIGNDYARGKIISGIMDKSLNPSKFIYSVPSYTTLLYVNPITLTGRTYLKFFERPASKLTLAERAGVPKADRFVRPFKVNNYPGYLLGLLMGGSPLEKLLSKSGLINVNNILNLSKKESKADLYIVLKVLNELFSGLKNIPYNKFKLAVLKELVDYEQVPDTRFQDYGLDRLHMGYTDGDLLLNTFTLLSPRIPIGSGKHYGTGTLGHIRTFTDKRNPKTLNVLESLSDWGLSKYVSSPKPYTGTSLYLNNLELYRKFIDGHKRLLLEMKDNPLDYSTGAIEGQEQNIAYHESIFQQMLSGKLDNLQTQYLHDNYIPRLLLEILKYGARNKYNKVRFPTPNTVATIEGYDAYPTRQYEFLEDRLSSLRNGGGNLPDEIDIFNDEGIFYTPERRASEIDLVLSEMRELEKSGKAFWYSPDLLTILNKYAGFPKLWQKKYKTPVRTVTDPENNTWYEVDIPKGYLNQEWKFKQGGKL